MKDYILTGMVVKARKEVKMNKHVLTGMVVKARKEENARL